MRNLSWSGSHQPGASMSSWRHSQQEPETTTLHFVMLFGMSTHWWVLTDAASRICRWISPGGIQQKPKKIKRPPDYWVPAIQLPNGLRGFASFFHWGLRRLATFPPVKGRFMLILFFKDLHFYGHFTWVLSFELWGYLGNCGSFGQMFVYIGVCLPCFVWCMHPGWT